MSRAFGIDKTARQMAAATARRRPASRNLNDVTDEEAARSNIGLSDAKLWFLVA